MKVRWLINNYPYNHNLGTCSNSTSPSRGCVTTEALVVLYPLAPNGGQHCSKHSRVQVINSVYTSLIKPSFFHICQQHFNDLAFVVLYLFVQRGRDLWLMLSLKTHLPIPTLRLIWLFNLFFSILKAFLALMGSVAQYLNTIKYMSYHVCKDLCM